MNYKKMCRRNYVNEDIHKKIHMQNTKTVHKHVDNVDNYKPKRFSPIFTTSPAPIVINKSLGVQFSNK